MLLVHAAGGAAHAQEEPARSFADAVRIAVGANGDVRAAEHRVDAAQQRARQAGALPDPRVSIARFIDPIETRLGPQRYRLGVGQTFPLFGKRGLRQAVATRAAAVENAHLGRERHDLRMRVARRWNEAYYLTRAIEVTRANLDLLSDFEEAALTRYALGETPHASVVQVQLELGRVEDRLRSLRDRRDPVAAALNAELGRSADAAIAWPDSVVAVPDLPARAELAQALRRHSPVFDAQGARVEEASVAARLARRSVLPDLTIAAEYVGIGDAPDVDDGGRDAFAASVSFDVPLSLALHRGRAREASRNQRAAEVELAQLERYLLAEMDAALVDLRDAARRARLHEHTLLPKARESVAVTTAAFASGETSFLQLIDAQRTSLEIELGYHRALADRAIALAHLEHVIGRRLDTWDVGGEP